MDKKYWVFEECKKCGHQNSHQAIGIPDGKYSTDELMETFHGSKCKGGNCDNLLQGNVQWYEHMAGLEVVFF